MSAELKAKYRHILDGIHQIPSLPGLVSQALTILNSNRSSAEEAARILELDIALSSKILRLANSAYYGVPGSVESIQRAIVLLGFTTVSSVVLSSSVYTLFSSGVQSHNLNRIAFWRHSIETAVYARVLATQMNGRIDPELAFTQGILHDLGVLALNTYFPQEYAHLLDHARRNRIPLEEAERELFGLEHAQIGARILEQWGLPASIYQPIYHHHQPLAAPAYQNYTLVLTLANQAAYEDGFVFYPQQQATIHDLNSLLVRLDVPHTMDSLRPLFAEDLKRAQFIMNLLRS